MAPTRRHRACGLRAQITLILTGLGAVTLAPPRDGPMLLLPLTGGAGAAITVAVRHGARVIGAGPVWGSVIVSGQRARIVPALLASGMLALAATPALCGATATGDREEQS